MIRLEPWNDFAQRALERVEGLGVIDVSREVREGVSQLWHCTDPDGSNGYVVTRLEQRPSGIEWVFVAGVGRGFYKFVQVFIDAAAAAGVPIRAHVHRPGMVRMYDRIGFKVSEYVLRKP
jgi:hypothetical protein